MIYPLLVQSLIQFVIAVLHLSIKAGLLSSKIIVNATFISRGFEIHSARAVTLFLVLYNSNLGWSISEPIRIVNSKIQGFIGLTLRMRA